MPRHIKEIVENVRYKVDKKFESKYVEVQEIIKKDYNLTVSRYLDKVQADSNIDIEELNSSIEDMVIRSDELRLSIKQIINELENVKK
jgi:type I restriction-modification system DNA methylase subunit